MNLRRASRDDADVDEGIALIEIMVALVVFALFATAALAAVLRGLDLTRTNHDRNIATNLAAQEIDKVRDQAALDSTALPTGQVTATQTVDKVPFTVTRETEWINADSSAGPCDGGTGSTHSARAYLHVDARVTWPKLTGAKPVHADTIVYPKVGSFDPLTGAVAVKVADSSATPQPQSGYTVTISGPVTRSALTASDGCAFFAYVPSGTYTATATYPGAVDYNGNTTATASSVGVTVGAITNASVFYDVAATAAVTPTPRDATHPAAPGLPIRFGNSKLTNQQTTSFCGYTYPATAPTYPCTVTTLFPFYDGDSVWAGDCLDAVPSTPLAVVLKEGVSTATGTTTLAALNVTVTSGGTPKANTPVFISHAADAASTGCSAVRTYKVGTTSSTGQLAVSVPFGKWTVSATTVQAPQTTAPTSRPQAYDVVTLTATAPTATALVTG